MEAYVQEQQICKHVGYRAKKIFIVKKNKMFTKRFDSGRTLESGKNLYLMIFLPKDLY